MTDREQIARIIASNLAFLAEVRDEQQTWLAEHLAEALSLPHGEGEAVAWREAVRTLLDTMSDTYTAGNGRKVGIQADDGEKCWIVHSDQIEALRALYALPPRAGEAGLRAALAAMLIHYGPPGNLVWTLEYPDEHPISLARAALSAAPQPGGED